MTNKELLRWFSASARHSHPELFALCVANLLFMHYYIFFNNYLEWTFLFSFPANLFSVLFDVFFLLTLTLSVTRLRLKAALAAVYGLTLAWALVNVFYARFFYIYFPLAAIGEATSLGDSLVIDNMLSGFQLTDTYFPVSIVIFLWCYRRTRSRRMSLKSISVTAMAALISMLLCLLSYTLYHFVHPQCRSNGELYVSRIRGLLLFVNDGGTPNLSRFQAGCIRTIACDIYDMLASHELTTEEQQMVTAFCTDEIRRVTHHERPKEIDNVVLVLLESFLSAPIGLEVEGREVTPFLNSLRADSSVYYNGKMKSDITCGESGDGQFLYMTGLLPLRHKMTVSTLKGKTYPALPRLLTSEMAVKNTQIIVPTLPNMWQQTDANAAYGIADIRSYTDIKAFVGENVEVDDKAIFRFAAHETSTLAEPFFTMILSVSTHSPYDSHCGPDLFGSCTSLPEPYRNYLNTCHFTDQWLAHYVDALKQKQLFRRTLIVICSDHHAHLDRLGMAGKITDHTPLFIVNGQIDSASAWHGEFRQLDTFTTITDLLSLQQWHGLGHTLLNPSYTNSATEHAYQVSRLIIESGFFPKNGATR